MEWLSTSFALVFIAKWRPRKSKPWVKTVFNFLWFPSLGSCQTHFYFFGRLPNPLLFLWAAAKTKVVVRPTFTYTCGSALFCQQIFCFFKLMFLFFWLNNFIIFSSNWHSNSIPVLSRAILVWVEQCWSKSKCTKQYAWANPSTYILFLALFPTLVSLLLMGQVRIYGTNSLDDRKHLNGFAAIAVLFDVYFTVNTICDNLLSFWTRERMISVIILLLLLASPLRIAVVAEREDAVAERSLSQKLLSTETSPLVDSPKLITAQAYHPHLPDHDEEEDLNMNYECFASNGHGKFFSLDNFFFSFLK